MAEQAQQQEEYQVALQACFDSKGWNLTVNRAGGVDEPLSDADMARFPADLEACRASMGLWTSTPPPLTETQVEQHYDMLLDVRECLIAEGLAMGPAPSKDAWVDESMRAQAVASDDEASSTWHPYTDPAFTAEPFARWEALEAACPQPMVGGQ